MNAREQTNAYKGGIVCLLQAAEPLKEPVGILSRGYCIISFSFWQAIALIASGPLPPFC